MATFMTRIELHEAVYQDYVNLHTYMRQEGFATTILSDDGVRYQLPPAEYALTANCTVVQAREKASRAAQKTLKRHAVLTAEYSGASWIGLTAVQQRAFG